jgi:hypothetical protein
MIMRKGFFPPQVKLTRYISSEHNTYRLLIVRTLVSRKKHMTALVSKHIQYLH